MLPFCDGSDLGGSLRNPGNFNNLIGLRPSPGRVPIWPAGSHWNPLGVYGPIARSAEDCALLLYAQSGGDARNPISLWEDPRVFLANLSRDFKGVKVAYSLDMGGLPMQAEVKRVLAQGLHYLQDLGVELLEDCPDFSEADAAFAVLRAFFAAQTWGPSYRKHRDKMKDTAIWNIEKGLALSAQEVSDALLAQSRVYERMRVFMQDYAFFVGPVNQVLPFDIDTPYPRDIEGVPMHDYVEWMQSASRITTSLHPALSCPIGFSQTGLPVGLQIVGRYRDELGLLQFAHAIEQLTQLAQRRPELA
jgi:amidase